MSVCLSVWTSLYFLPVEPPSLELVMKLRVMLELSHRKTIAPELLYTKLQVTRTNSERVFASELKLNGLVWKPGASSKAELAPT